MLTRQPDIKRFTREDSREISCALWGGLASAVPAFCIHGLTRNGRDFDYLGQSLSEHRHVICPDVVGRGASDHLQKGEIYDYDLYVEDALFVMDQLGLSQVDWVGTSMGGILGMRMAAEYPDRIRKLVINDIAAVITLEVMQLLCDYVGQHMEHPSREAAEQYVRTTYGAFGLNKDWQWEHLINHSFHSRADGSYRLVYDDQILNGIKDAQGNMILAEDIDLLPFLDAIKQPILLLRGEHSEFLSKEMAQKMAARHPNTTLVEFKDCGHAPALMDDVQVEVVKNWLLS